MMCPCSVEDMGELFQERALYSHYQDCSFPFILETIAEEKERCGCNCLKEFHVSLVVAINIWASPDPRDAVPAASFNCSQPCHHIPAPVSRGKSVFRAKVR